jgi:hypothetical protein
MEEIKVKKEDVVERFSVNEIFNWQLLKGYTIGLFLDDERPNEDMYVYKPYTLKEWQVLDYYLYKKPNTTFYAGFEPIHYLKVRDLNGDCFWIHSVKILRILFYVEREKYKHEPQKEEQS